MSLLNDPAVEGEVFLFIQFMARARKQLLRALKDLESTKNLKERAVLIDELRELARELPWTVKQLERIVGLGMRQAHAYGVEDGPSRLATKKNTIYRTVEQAATEACQKAMTIHNAKYKESNRKFSKADWARKNLVSINKKYRIELKLRTLQGYLNNL